MDPNENGMPQPDFSESDSDFESICDENASKSSVCNSAILPKVKGSISQPDLFSLSKSCNPDTTFLSTTPTGIQYDIDNPIYQTKSCTLYIGRRNGHYYALKTSPSSRILIHEWEVFKEIGKYPTIIEAIDLIKIQTSSSIPKPVFPKSPFSSSYFLQLDYAFGGSISNTLQYFDFQEAWKVLAHISSALNHMHQNGYIHLDVSPSNILICNNKQSYDICSCQDYVRNVIYKLADFGTVIKEGNFQSFNEGSGPYVSPEALQYPNSIYPVSYPADIWSLGAVMFEIVTHKKMPRDSERYRAIRRGDINLSEIIPEEFEIIIQMLSVDPSMRPTAEQITQLPIVKDILEKLETQLEFDNEHSNLSDDIDDDSNESSLHNNLVNVSAKKKNRHKRLSDDGIIARRKSFDRI